MSKEKEQVCAARRGKTGGEALIEGVMMKSAKLCAISVRMPDGSIKTKVEESHPIKEKYPILGIPLVRGVVGFVESMVLSFRSLTYSTEALGIDDMEPETKFEKWLDEKLGDRLMGVIMTIATVLGVVLALALFVGIPSLISGGVNRLFSHGLSWQLGLIEGLTKILIFIGYLWAVSRIPDIRRTFEYHGAEHKTIFCYEAGDDLTPENVKKHSRFHPRCGTAFLFVMLLISILIFSLIYLIPGFNTENTLLRMAIRLPVLPLLFGLGYEFIRFAGCHDGPIIRFLCQPGLLMQRLTTREPDEKQIEVAIMSLKLSLPEDFPEAAEEAAAAAPKEKEPQTSADTEQPDDAPSDEEAGEAESKSENENEDENGSGNAVV